MLPVTPRPADVPVLLMSPLLFLRRSSTSGVNLIRSSQTPPKCRLSSDDNIRFC